MKVPSTMPVENMNHLLSGSEFDLTEQESVHYSQLDKKGIKLILLFMLSNGSLASIRIPRNFPVFKIRMLVKFLEKELIRLYGDAKRTNFVMAAPEESDEYEILYDLPMNGVSYK